MSDPEPNLQLGRFVETPVAGEVVRAFLPPPLPPTPPIDVLALTFDEPIILGGNSGLHLVWQVPTGLPGARQIQVMAREQGIGVYALSSGAAYDFDPKARDDMLVFGYSSLTEPQIEDAVGRLHLKLEKDRSVIC